MRCGPLAGRPVGEAGRWTAVVVTAAALFNAWIFQARGMEAGLQFLTGYLIELALSVDNIFVFILIFSYFGVPAAYQHRVLFWGIFGAIVMRGAMIAAGWLLLERFHWIIYVFGAILIITGIRMLRADSAEIEPEKNPLVRLARRFLPISAGYERDHFTCHAITDRRVFTPLVLVVLVVEWSDLVFAIDSIPASARMGTLRIGPVESPTESATRDQSAAFIFFATCDARSRNASSASPMSSSSILRRVSLRIENSIPSSKTDSFWSAPSTADRPSTSPVSTRSS